MLYANYLFPIKLEGVSQDSKKKHSLMLYIYIFVEEGRVKYSKTEAKECILFLSQLKMVFYGKSYYRKGRHFQEKKS